MIAATFTTHLYCNCKECQSSVAYFDEYVGKSKADTYMQARKDGWRISRDECRAYAPNHKIQRRNEKISIENT